MIKVFSPVEMFSAHNGSAKALSESWQPDSGQEHPANGNDCFLVSAASLDPAVTFLALRVFVGFDDSVSDLNQKRLQIAPGAGNASRFDLVVTLVVTRTAARPGSQMFRRRKH